MESIDDKELIEAINTKITESKPLDPEFVEVIEEEFWNLVEN